MRSFAQFVLPDLAVFGYTLVVVIVLRRNNVGMLVEGLSSTRRSSFRFTALFTALTVLAVVAIWPTALGGDYFYFVLLSFFLSSCFVWRFCLWLIGFVVCLIVCLLIFAHHLGL